MTTNLIEAAERALDAMLSTELQLFNLQFDLGWTNKTVFKKSDELITLTTAIEAAKSVEREQLTWKEAVLNELIVCHIYNSSHDNDPRKAMQDAITCNCQIALDPTVSSEAQALIDRGAVESRAEIEAKVLEEAANEIGHCWRCKADDTLNGMAADRRVSKPSAPNIEQASEVERDAARYRWLHNEHMRFDPLCHLSWKRNWDRNSSYWVNTDDLDKSIDAAIGAEREGE